MKKSLCPFIAMIFSPCFLRRLFASVFFALSLLMFSSMCFAQSDRASDQEKVMKGSELGTQGSTVSAQEMGSVESRQTGATRIEAIRTYFRKVDAGDPTILDLFTEDLQMYFPKFGLARGKRALVTFAERMGANLATIGHDIDGLTFHVSGDTIVVEGREWGTNAGWQGLAGRRSIARPLLQCLRIRWPVDPAHAHLCRPRLHQFRSRPNPHSAKRTRIRCVCAGRETSTMSTGTRRE